MGVAAGCDLAPENLDWSWLSTRLPDGYVRRAQEFIDSGDLDSQEIDYKLEIASTLAGGGSPIGAIATTSMIIAMLNALMTREYVMLVEHLVPRAGSTQ